MKNVFEPQKPSSIFRSNDAKTREKYLSSVSILIEKLMKAQL